MRASDFASFDIKRRTRSEVLPVFMTATGSVRDWTITPEGVVSDIGDKRAEPKGLAGAFVTQGLVDLQVNGFAGVDFNRPGLSPDQIDYALTAMARTGVTSFLPTVITGATDRMIATLRDLDEAVSASRLGPLMVAGYHIEGPFLSPKEGYAGAHSAAYMTTAGIGFVDELRRVASRPIVIMTVAPEVEGVPELIPSLVKRGMHVSIGHSAASLAQIEAAIAAGATLSTHLGNGLPQMQHKTDNTIFWQLAQDQLVAMFIADGIHVPRPALQTMLRAKGADRTILTTDAVSAAGMDMPPGLYSLGKTEIELSAGGVVRIPGSAYLAGASVTMDQMLRNLVSWYDMPVPRILQFVHHNPARFIAPPAAGLEETPVKLVEWQPSPDGPRVSRTHIGPFTIE